ncbi:hypothetical protein [Arsukibacterium indicum]|uniref:Uncharacterized protein n=1 Tax=Arsukibacterium indicum TaxID=2848612 RepID=A0ABS6MG30_9GAMM|nr:hypothetical protein [Arsukibacterium indicum]MBV2127771.1 hypothetical protein [Arsukibacterium indicum]
MKKLVVAAAVALAFNATAVVAQDQAGGANATGNTIGGVAVETIAAGAVGVAVAAAIISNNSGTSLPIQPPPPPPPPPLSCEGDDPLVDGECIGTTTTVTVTGTGTGTNTTTIAVPVTFTYAPSAQ